MSSYRVVADPRETTVDADGLDGVIVTGDILAYAPPPGEEPDGSVIAEYGDGIEDAYDAGDIDRIVDAIDRLRDEPGVRQAARERYEDWMDDIEDDVFYISGNLDFPDILEDVAGSYDTIEPAETLDDVVAVEGFVPSFADLPEDTFPGSEIDADSFYEEIEQGRATYLVAHELPDGFDPDAYGFERAFASTDGDGVREDGLVLLAGVDTGDEADLTIP